MDFSASMHRWLADAKTNFRPVAMQFMRYLISGGSAAGLAVAGYSLLVWLGVWYVLASVISDGIGFFLAFLFHKYFVFQKKGRGGMHMMRYTLLQIGNTIVQAGILYILVDFGGMDKILARILTIGIAVSWNFFFYKYFVYL